MGGRKGTKDPVRPPHVASLPSGLGWAGDVLVVSETRVVGNRQRVSWLSPSRPPSVRKALQTAAARATCNTRSNTSARRPSRLSDMRLALVGRSSALETGGFGRICAGGRQPALASAVTGFVTAFVSLSRKRPRWPEHGSRLSGGSKTALRGTPSRIGHHLAGEARQVHALVRSLVIL